MKPLVVTSGPTRIVLSFLDNVALTRTKNKVFLLVNEDMNDRSIFINEIYQIIKENTTS